MTTYFISEREDGGLWECVGAYPRGDVERFTLPAAREKVRALRAQRPTFSFRILTEDGAFGIEEVEVYWPETPLDETPFMRFWAAINASLTAAGLREIPYGPAKRVWNQAQISARIESHTEPTS